MDRLVSVAMATLLLAACAATPEASSSADADAKRFESAPRAAIVYLYRTESPVDAATSTIWVDGRLVGQTLPKTYFRVAVRPGHNHISALGGAALDIETRPDEVYFVAVQVPGNESSGFTIFRTVSPEVGKAAILRCCTQLETWRPGQWRINP